MTLFLRKRHSLQVQFCFPCTPCCSPSYPGGLTECFIHVAVAHTGLPVIKRLTSQSRRKKCTGLVFMEFTLLTHVLHHSKGLMKRWKGL